MFYVSIIVLNRPSDWRYPYNVSYMNLFDAMQCRCSHYLCGRWEACLLLVQQIRASSFMTLSRGGGWCCSSYLITSSIFPNSSSFVECLAHRSVWTKHVTYLCNVSREMCIIMLNLPHFVILLGISNIFHFLVLSVQQYNKSSLSTY